MKLYPDDWRVRLCGAAGAGVGAAFALFVVKPMIELPGWTGGLAFAGLLIVGILLGNVVGLQLFKPSSNVSP